MTLQKNLISLKLCHLQSKKKICHIKIKMLEFCQLMEYYKSYWYLNSIAPIFFWLEEVYSFNWKNDFVGYSSESVAVFASDFIINFWGLINRGLILVTISPAKNKQNYIIAQNKEFWKNIVMNVFCCLFWQVIKNRVN